MLAHGCTKYLYVVKAQVFLLSCCLLVGFSACDQAEELQLEAPQNKYILCRGTTLYLNNGQKWNANKETTEGIDKMIARVDAFHPDTSIVAYRTLGKDLMDDLVYIVNYCAEMGDNHEMVHAYLNPMQELIVPLQISGLEVCQAQVAKIQEHLVLYHQYFE